MGKIVTDELDILNLPPPSEERKAELAVLAQSPDKEIDFSDIPPLTEKFRADGLRDPDPERARKAG